MVNKSFSVSSYCRSVRRLMQEEIPPIWVHGVITRLTIRTNIVYLEIAEFKEGSEQPEATLSLKAFRRDWDVLVQKAAAAAKPFELAVELKVSFKIQADFYVPQGRFQAQILDIDPVYTLGELVNTRQAIIKSLTENGLLNRNKSQTLAVAPLKIALITSQDSAAENDFLKIISDSPWSFEVLCYNAVMQGRKTENSVGRALDCLLEKEPDVICLVRGGGSRTDLVYFDSKVLAEKIALAKVPVLTGIGHEIDESICDLVSWKNLMTPSRCAHFLVDTIAQSFQGVMDRSSSFQKRVQRNLDFKMHSLDNRLANLKHKSQSVLRGGQLQQKQKCQDLSRIWSSQSRMFTRDLRFIYRQLKEKYAYKWKGLRGHLEQNQHGLVQGSQKILLRFTEQLELKTQLFNARDPRKLLAKGYAIVRLKSSSGKSQAMKSKGKVIEPKVGEEIIAQLQNFKLSAKITKVEKND